LGKACEPVFEPLGLNWKSSVALISGIAAKEVVVSTIGVLYSHEEVDEPQNLNLRLESSGEFSKASVLALLVFTLLYFPCIATFVAIKNEGGGWKCAIVTAVYTIALAWVAAFITFRVASLFL
jgi:ferrous iron transport protein B